MNSHGAVFLQRFQIALELLQMITEDKGLICVINHVEVAEILRSIPLVLAADLHDFVDAITSTVHSDALFWSLDTIIFLVLAAVHFH